METKDNNKIINELKVNLFLKYFYDAVYEKEDLLLDNLGCFYNLIVFLLDYLKDYENFFSQNIDFYKISRFNLSEKVTIINDFYKKIGLNLNINELISNGIFNPYIVGNSDDENFDNDPFLSGYMKYINDKPTIDVYDTGLITDAAIWVHELSHFLDVIKVNEVIKPKNILTESMAYAYELLFLDYIDSLGYSYEASVFKKHELNSLYNTLTHAYALIKPYILFNEFGEVSKENYLTYFGYDDDYDEILAYFVSHIISNKEYDSLYEEIYYSIAASLSTYMYVEYTKDNNFSQNIINMQKELLNDSSIEKCLKHINLTTFDDEFYEKIKASLDDFIFELENGSDKIIASTALTNDYFGELVTLYYKDKNMAFDKVNEIFSLITFLKNHICKYIEDNIPVFEYEKFSKANIEEKIELINAFYKYLGTSFRLNQEILSNNFNIEDACTEKYLNDKDTSTLINKIGSGTSYFDEQIQVDVYDSGLLYDSITWIHELKHLQNQPLGNRSQISFVLTESLSFMEELIYTDFLEKLGYNYEAYISKYDTFSNFSVFLEDAYPMIKMLSVYVNYGEISKQNYEKAYPTDEYENDIDEVLTLLTEDAEDFFNLIRYPVASALSIYMYEKYKKDNNFIVKINEFEKAINTANNINDCLNIIGLSGLNKESLNKIESSLNTFKKELNNIIQSNTINLFNIEKNKVI